MGTSYGPELRRACHPLARRKALEGREASWGPEGSFYQPGPLHCAQVGMGSSSVAGGKAKQFNTLEGTSLEGLRPRLSGPHS